MASTVPELEAAATSGGSEQRLAGTRSRRWAPSALGNLGLLVGSLMVAAVLVEVLIRVAAPQQLVLIRPDVWQSVDTVGWRFRPNLSTRINTGERTVHLFTDRDGFRVGSAGRREARTRVLLLGDSYMAALQVEYEQSLAGLLEQRLPARVGSPVAIRNAGQAGWDPPQYLFEARSLLSRDTFALVVVSMYVGNDVVTERPARIPPRLPVETSDFRLPRTLSSAEVIAALFRPTNDILKQRSHAFIFLKSRLQPILMRLGLTAEYFPEEFRRSTARSPRWDVTCGILADIAGLAAHRGIPTLFVLIPAPFQVEPAVFQRYAQAFGLDSSQVDLDQPTRLVRDGLEARGLAVLDMLTDFRETDGRGSRLYGAVDRHFTPRGHEVMEQLVEPKIVELLRRGRS